MSSRPAAQSAAKAHEALRLVYVVPLFPCWSETWIVREIRAHLNQGVRVTVLSLRHPSEAFAHPEAIALSDLVMYPPKGWAAARAVGKRLRSAPEASLGSLGEAVRALWRRPLALAKTCVVWWRTLAVAGQIAETAPHLIHAHFASFPSTSAMILSRLLHVPFSFTCHAHDIFVEDHLLRQKLERAAVAVTISDFNRRFIGDRLGEVPASRFEIIHCGVAVDDFEYRSGQREPGSILAVARLDEVKGFRFLVEACRILRDRGRTLRCEIVGEGTLRSVLEEQIAAAGLGGMVTLPGAMPQAQVRERMYRAAVFALPSVVATDGNRDGIPVALMEAMATGIPVVSTPVSGIPELVKSGWSGLLAEPGDAEGLASQIEAILDDPDRAAQMAAHARETIEQHFDADREAAKLLASFKSALAR